MEMHFVAYEQNFLKPYDDKVHTQNMDNIDAYQTLAEKTALKKYGLFPTYLQDFSEVHFIVKTFSSNILMKNRNLIS